jgi:hypothetical protein
MKTTLNRFILALLLLQSTAFAQSNEPTLMHKFMQANADSTLILAYTSNWVHTPQYYLLSRKGDTLTCYSYKVPNLDRSVLLAPKKIRQQIIENDSKKFSEPVDINNYFKIYKMTEAQVKTFWDDVNAFKPWMLKDDSTEGEGCPAAAHKKTDAGYPVISDGGGISLALITNKEIRFLEFYAPDFYEEHCPGRPGRIAINGISKLFLSNFK